MAHYEIVAHVTRELPCDTAEEAAAIFRRQLLASSESGDSLQHLAVWRQDAAREPSALTPALRQQLVDFFAALERSAGEAEEDFRGRVAAILMKMPGGDGDVRTYPGDEAR